MVEGPRSPSINDDLLSPRQSHRTTDDEAQLSFPSTPQTNKSAPGASPPSPYLQKLAGPGRREARRPWWPSLGVGLVGAASFAARFGAAVALPRRARAVVFVYARAGGVLYIHWHGAQFGCWLVGGAAFDSSRRCWSRSLRISPRLPWLGWSPGLPFEDECLRLVGL